MSDYRCRDCLHYVQISNRKKGRCKLKCTSTWSDIRYGYIKACKRFFELKEQKNGRK